MVRGDRFGRVSLGTLKKHLLKAVEEGKFEKNEPQLADVGVDPDRIPLTKIAAVFTEQREKRYAEIQDFLKAKRPADLVNAIGVYRELEENELCPEEDLGSFRTDIQNE